MNKEYIEMDIKIDNRPICIKRKWGPYPAKYIEGMIDIINKKEPTLKDIIIKKKTIKPK